MAKGPGKPKNHDGDRIVKPSRKKFFIEKTLYRVILSNNSKNIVYLFNLYDQKEQTMLLSDFKKVRKRAYTVIDTARLLNRSEIQMYRYIKKGMVDPPTGAAAGGARGFQILAYYSEVDVFNIRKAISETHRGRPRKDGKRVNNCILTEQELRAKMGDAIMLYTKTEDGRFVPTWAESAY